MERVLLTIQGESPSRGALRYAVGLCSRLKARLSVLHIIVPKVSGGRVQKIKQRVAKVRQGFESAMAAATFAEAGDIQTAEMFVQQFSEVAESLNVDPKETGLEYHLKISADNPGKEIINHVREHRDVVVAICDMAPGSQVENAAGKKARGRSAGTRTWARKLEQRLPVPLVMVTE